MAKALATASVIMAKKMVRTRRLNRPISAASATATTSPATMPTATAVHSAPSRVSAIATP